MMILLLNRVNQRCCYYCFPCLLSFGFGFLDMMDDVAIVVRDDFHFVQFLDKFLSLFRSEFQSSSLITFYLYILVFNSLTTYILSSYQSFCKLNFSFFLMHLEKVLIDFFLSPKLLTTIKRRNQHRQFWDWDFIVKYAMKL